MKDGLDTDIGESGGLENGLPQPFVESMRTLFDILDDQHTGRVKFSDIERRWHEDEDCSSSGLPAGVLDSLRVVTPLDGYLSFARFCKGLQICLLRSKSGNPSLMVTSSSSSSASSTLEGNKSSRRTGTNRETRDDGPPPPLPPPLRDAPPLQHDMPPPPLQYNTHPSNYITDRKLSSTHSSTIPVTSTKPLWSSSEAPGRSQQPLPSDKSQNSFNLEQFLQTHHAKHRNIAYNDSKAGYPHKKHSDAVILQRSSSNDSKPRYEPANIIENTISHYNNSNNINLSVAHSRANQFNSNSTKSSPRKNNSSGTSRSSGSRGGSESSNSKTGFGNLHKTDIRMGTGGMMSLYGTKLSTQQSQTDSKLCATLSQGQGLGQAQGPPKPPRRLESQTSDGSLSSRLSSSVPDRKGSTNSQHSAGSINRVDNIINKMEALHTYGMSTNNKKEKIYDRLTKGRGPFSNDHANIYVANGGPKPTTNDTADRRSAINVPDATSHHPSSLYNQAKLPGISSSTSTHQPPVQSPLGSGGRPPAALPLSVLNGYSLQRSQTHSIIATHSLERDSRADGRRVLQESSSRTRTRRGGSLERLLDGGGGEGHHYSHPHYHSREGSNDTTSTAPPQPYHWTSDWNAANNNINNNNHSSSNAVTTSTSNVLPQRYHYQQQQSSQKQQGSHAVQKQNEHNTAAIQPSDNSPAAVVDHRLTMNSYAWIRGSEDSSGSDVNNTDQQLLATYPTAVTYAAAPAPAAATAPAAPAPAAAPSSSEGTTGRSHSKKGRSRRDGRRHTLQNGLDYAAVRRAGQLEAERDMLHQGLQVVEQARQWYRTQLHQLLYSLQHNSSDTNFQYNSEAQQQKLHYQLARITEINMQLDALMNASQMPDHLALATCAGAGTGGGASAGTSAGTGTSDGTGGSNSTRGADGVVKMEGKVKRLRDQNQQLTEEVSQKSQHIAVLEQDKSRLLRELFQARTASTAMHSPGQADSTFM